MYEAINNLFGRSEFSVIESFELPGRPALYEEVPKFLFDSRVGDYLKQWSREIGSGQSGLWAHQAQALKALGCGDNIVVSTGTASGKSLVFRALALHKVLLDPSSRVVVFYPLRALVADQFRGWREMSRSLGLDEENVGRIDGEVPSSDRDEVLQKARIIVMTLQLVAATATISNPGDHMKQLTGAEFTAIDHEADGAPRYERIVAHVASPEGEELKIDSLVKTRFEEVPAILHI